MQVTKIEIQIALIPGPSSIVLVEVPLDSRGHHGSLGLRSGSRVKVISLIYKGVVLMVEWWNECN